jgi:hypothetical protein
MATSLSTVLNAIIEEREYQIEKCGLIEESIPGYLIILESELKEAKKGWLENIEGRDSSLEEIVQIAAVCIACLAQHGISGNGEIK